MPIGREENSRGWVPVPTGQQDAEGNEKGKDVAAPSTGLELFAEFLPMPPTCGALTKTEGSRGVLQHPLFSTSQLGKHIWLGAQESWFRGRKTDHICSYQR